MNLHLRLRVGSLMLVLLGLILTPSAAALAQEEKPDPSLKPSFGEAKLQGNFSPDPKQVKVKAGGPIKTNLGGVDTYVTKEPTFTLDYDRGQYTFPLTIYAVSKADVTLLIQLPDGQWVADRFGLGIARLRFAPGPKGRYAIWVGTTGKDGAEATIGFSEARGFLKLPYGASTLKYKTPEACQKAVTRMRTDFKGKAHVLASFAHFVDVFLLEKGQYPKDDLEWEDTADPILLPIPVPEPLAQARGGKPEKIIADERAKVFGKTGKNVIIALIDDGIDFRWPDFWVERNGKKESRLLYYWNMHASSGYAGDKGTTQLTATNPDGTPIGRLYSRANLTAELNRKQEPPVWAGGPTKIPTGARWQTNVRGEKYVAGNHGTGCAAIAAGQGSANGQIKPGVAPDADLIMVRCNNLFLLNAACEWLERVAKDQGKPLVISLSMGTPWGGGYDGLRGPDQHLNARFSLDKKGFAACLCAGNEGRGTYNTFVELDPKGKSEAKISWDAPLDNSQLVFYFDTPDLNDLAIEGPQATLLKPFFHAASGTVRTNEFFIKKGKGEVTLRATGQRKVGVEAYILSGRGGNNKGKIKSDRDAEGKVWDKRINAPGTIANSITVGSYNWSTEVNEKNGIGFLSEYSSPGPRRVVGDKATPWLVAPGEKFFAPNAAPESDAVRLQPRDDMNGTSSATPYTAGFVALMFECKKDLTFGQVRELLAEFNALTRNEITAKDGWGNYVVPEKLRTPAMIALQFHHPNSHWGYGKLDVEAAHRILKKLTAAK